MTYVGIDTHKRYSVVGAIDSKGQAVGVERVWPNSAAGFSKVLGRISDGKCRVVIEACWNWSTIYDMLRSVPAVQEVIMAHPLKTRLIADAQIKTDKLDALALARLLRGGLIAQAHIPSARTREVKQVLRQRLYTARLRTRMRNRIHALLDRHPEASLPQASDPFSVKRLKVMRSLELPHPDGGILAELLAIHDLISEQMRVQDKRITQEGGSNPTAAIIRTLPGMGMVLAPVVAAEIDSIDRFHASDKLCAYAGLVPTTHSSGGKTYHGRLLPECNKWLRWAFVEAAWVAVGCSPYFGALYRRYRDTGKPASKAILAVARRMCQITWRMLVEQRPYRPEPLSQNPSTKTKPFPRSLRSRTDGSRVLATR